MSKISFEFPRGQLIEINFPRGQWVRHHAIRVTVVPCSPQATDDITVFGLNKEQRSSDGFLVLPVDSLGQEYYSLTGADNTPAYHQVLVVGVEDGTTVTFEFPSSFPGQVDYDGNTYQAGDTFSETLDRYDTLQLASLGNMIGIHIASDKVISTFSGSQKGRAPTVSTGYRDHMAEQLVPTSCWGTIFATVPTPGRTTGDMFHILALEDSTVVSLSSQIADVNLNAGEHTTLDIPSTEYTTISSNQPISVMQYAKNMDVGSLETGDPHMLTIVPLNQFAGDYIFSPLVFNYSTFTHRLTIIIKDSEKDGLYLNDALMTGLTWSPVSGSSPSLVATETTLQVGNIYRLNHESPTVTFGANLYGWTAGESYSFPAGMRLTPVNEVRLNASRPQ